MLITVNVYHVRVGVCGVNGVRGWLVLTECSASVAVVPTQSQSLWPLALSLAGDSMRALRNVHINI